MNDDVLLEVKGLRTCFDTASGPVAAVDGVHWSVGRGEILAIVGESGCGKSVTAMSVLRLIPTPPGRITDGQIMFRDGVTRGSRDLLAMSDGEIRKVRGRQIAMIFQEPGSALNPVLTVGRQIGEVLEHHRGMGRRQAVSVATEMLERVGMADASRRVHEYPHQMSGGMLQRVMMAMALVCEPVLLIADEPTTALDVTVQAQVLALLRDMRDRLGMTIVLITHDLGVVAQFADRVCVMYAGKIVERAAVGVLFERPVHPYTRSLLQSMPRLSSGRGRMSVIRGNVPRPIDFPAGCRFHPRCELTKELAERGAGETLTCRLAGESWTVLKRCAGVGEVEEKAGPALRTVGEGHDVACWEAEGFSEAPSADHA